jgi:hypothetical protein
MSETGVVCPASPLVVGTPAVVSFLHQDVRLSVRARTAITPAVAERVSQFLSVESFGFRLAPPDRLVADATTRIPPSEVPDLPNRVVAATAVAPGLPLVTRDGKIRNAALHTIW